MAPRPCAIALAAAALVGAACGEPDSAADADAAAQADASQPTGDGAPGGDPDAGPRADGGGNAPFCSPTDTSSFALELVADGFDRPLFVTSPPGDPRLFVVDQPGVIWVVEDGERLAEPFLDLTGEVTTGGSEQGLLGLAFHPEYAQNGRLFVNYTTAGQEQDAAQGDTVVAEFGTSASDPDVADPGSKQVLLTVGQPARNHNGGQLGFGPDGHLYIGLGDGGGANDQYGNGQDPTTLLGSMLRIDIDAGDPYGIPDDNPFADGGGRAEIWATGLRNPWRWSFDRATRNLYIGDVGQGEYEEVNVAPPDHVGANYGWNLKEGDHCFEADTCDESGLTDPLAEYDRSADSDSRCSVTGGYVYRGDCLEGLQGRYLYADYCTSQIYSVEYGGGPVTDPEPVAPPEEITAELDPDGTLQGISSFGEDAYGELYVTSMFAGEVYRIVAEEAP